MPKASTRFRNRKINFKTPVPIYIGSFESPFEDELFSAVDSPATINGGGSGGSSLPPGYGKNEAGETVRVETGVDKEEEGEHHLQAVISASAAALLRSGPGGLAVSKPAMAHIPTPDATGVVSNYSQLYRPNTFVDPHSYIRFGDTIEETIGIPYTMDEDDADWLEDYNESVAGKQTDLADGASNPTQTRSALASPASAKLQQTNGQMSPSTGNAKSIAPLNFLATAQGHYPPMTGIAASKHARARREKGKDLPTATTPLAEDDFELVMDLFERATDRKVPTLHMDVTRIPTLEDLEAFFPAHLPGYLVKTARILAKIVYPHWKERRLAAGGKNVVPQLDYDETNETPYVCFRRREAKVARKTRRTDTQTMERLVRLKSDLSSAQELLIKVLDRERCKREAASTESRIFEHRSRVRDVKRKLGENEGDEMLLISRREKRRKREDSFQQQQLPGSNKIVLPNRPGQIGITPGLALDPLPPYKDRTGNATARVDKDMQRKREQEAGWEDLTDTAFAPLPAALPSRYWRAAERLYLLAQDGRKSTEVVTFDHLNPPYVQGPGQRFRKRIGRGGRVHLDRLLPRLLQEDDDYGEGHSSDDSDEDREASREFSRRRAQERWRYDSDVTYELPATRHPTVVDDFDARFAASRATLVPATDWESLFPNTLHVEEALRWTLKEPERLPPIQVLGRLPGQPKNQNNGYPLVNGTINNPLTANMASQMLAAANRAQHVAQATAQSVAAAQLRRASTHGGTNPAGSPAVQPMPTQHSNMSSNGASNGGGNVPQPPQIRRLMWENGTAAG